MALYQTSAGGAARAQYAHLFASVQSILNTHLLKHTPARSELDEKKARMAELEQQVAELTMQTEYQLRLKDLHLQEKVKELTGG
jgi:uncharacterized protein YceH (UPF0502 family)